MPMVSSIGLRATLELLQAVSGIPRLIQIKCN